MRARRASTASAHAALIVVALLGACSGPPQPVEPAPVIPADDPRARPLPVDPPPSVPLPGERAGSDDAPIATMKLDNGLDVALLRHRPDGSQTASFTLTFRAGTEHGKPGTADLASELFVRGADLTAGRAGLRARIERLGGTLHVDVGARSTWFTVRIAEPRWRPALSALAEALRAPPPGRSQLEREHDLLLRERGAELARMPLRRTVERMLLGDAGGGDHLLNLQERDPSEGVLFQARNYRPDRAALVLRVPADPVALAGMIQGEFGPWTTQAVSPDPNAGPHERRPPDGIRWSDTGHPGEPCEAALVFSLPDPLDARAVPAWMLLNAVTMDGIGGRLERLMQDNGLGHLTLHPFAIDGVDRPAQVLTTTATPAEAVQLYELAQTARRSLIDLPLTDSERQLARGRTWLSLRRPESSAVSALRLRVLQLMVSLSEDRMLERLAELEQPDALGASVVGAFAELPLALVVVGGQPPEGTEGVRTFELVPASYAIGGQLPANDALVQAAQPWLERAVRAAGGADLIRRVTGLQASMAIVTEEAPDAEETFDWGIDGRLLRTLTVLGSTVRTSIEGNEWTEQVADEQLQLSPVEANWHLSEVERHPLALLAAHCQGRLPFRMVSSKQVGDREHVVVEAITDRFERLRAQIDRESGLIRVVETWTLAPEGLTTRAVDTWTDYRTVDGIRVPFRRTTVIDDGRSRRVVTYSRVQPTRG